MKTCADCKSSLEETSFCKKRGTPDGYSYHCRDCTSKRAKKYYQTKNGVKEKAIERNKKAILAKKIYVY